MLIVGVCAVRLFDDELDKHTFHDYDVDSQGTPVEPVASLFEITPDDVAAVPDEA